MAAIGSCSACWQALLSGPTTSGALGIGGLLAEIPSRPLPREARPTKGMAPRIAAIVLAAGRSSRMGSNKLLLDLNGQADRGTCAEHRRARLASPKSWS